MHQGRKCSLAFGVAVAAALCAHGALAATPPHALLASYLDNALVPSSGRLIVRAPVGTAALGGHDTRLAIKQTRANIATSCGTFVVALPPSATTEWCLDNESLPPRDPLNASPLFSASAPERDSTWPAISSNWAHAIALSAPVVSAEASLPAEPDLRPDHPPVPPPVRNIWAPISAAAPGGSGTWSLTSATWTDINGDGPAAMSPQPGFAAFQGNPGTVTVDDSAGAISITGMHFAVDGYTLTGGALQLAGNAGSAVNIDVSGYNAVINNVLTGDLGLNEVGFGTLVLAGDNTYSGGTTISSDTLQLGNGGTSGSIVGDVTDNGLLEFNRSDSVTYGGVISGYGKLTQTGTGTLMLTGTNTYADITNIDHGKLALAGDGSISDSFWVQVNSDGTLDISGTNDGATLATLVGTGSVLLGEKTLTLTNQSGYEFDGVISGTGGVTLRGGTLVLKGVNTYTGLTTIDPNTWLTVGGGDTGASIVSDVLDEGTLEFQNGASAVFGGVISGSGFVMTQGESLTLTGDNTFSGTILVRGPAPLIVSSDANLGSTSAHINLEGTLETTGSFALEQTLTFEAGNAATLQTDDGTVLTIPNTVSNVGTLTKSGAGTLVLTGNNTNAADFYGPTTIAAGTLQIGDGGTSGSIAGSITDNGSLVFDRSDAVTYDGYVSGFGSVTQAGAGTLILTGDSTYTGGTTISSGILQIGNGGTTGSITGDVSAVGYATLAFYRSDDLTFDGVISGSGFVVQEGGGTLTLTGTNTYSGPTMVINSGALQVSSDANLGATPFIDLVDKGTLRAGGAFTLSHRVETQGNASIDTNGYALTVTGDVFGDGSGSSALIKEGLGTLTLLGSLTYEGLTTINAGTLQAATALPGNATVAADGTLDAVPGVAGDLSNAGKVAVHGGDTTVGGNYTSSGTLAVSLGSKLAMTGTATLNGGTLEVTGADSGYVANTHTDVLTATGGVTGTFTALVKDPGVVFTSTTIGYGANDVYLDTTGLNITMAAASMGIVEPAAVSAAQRVQTGFETINASMASGGTPSSNVLQGAGAIQHSATPAVAQATLTSLSGQLHAASAAMLFDGIDARSNALSEHFDDLVSGRAKSGVWYSDLGWQGNLQRSGYAGATFRSDGGMAGADLRIGSHALLGFAAGQSLGFGQLDAAWDHNRTWMNNIAVYGGVMNGPWYASAQIANGWYREDMQRLLQLGALGSPVGTASTGRYSAGALEGGRLIRIGTVHVEPFVDARYQRLDLGGFTEQGGLGYGLKAEARSAGRLQAGLGLRAERGWRLANGMQIEFDGSAGWQHTLHQYGDVFDASFTSFNDWLPVEGIGLSRNTAILRAGLSLWPAPNFGLRLGYMYEQDQRERAGSAMLQGTVTF